MSSESVRWSKGCVALASLLALVVLGVIAARAEVLEGEWYYEGEVPYEGELPPEGEGEAPFQSHPGDSNGDGRMTMSEAIGYLACWQQGGCLMSYAIRAAYLWQNGEGYAYNGSLDPPMCWELPEPAEGEVVYSLMLGLGAVDPQYVHGSITPDPAPDELCPPVPGQPWCGLYPEGTEVWLTPMPNAGYAFDHWTGDLSGSQVSALVVMNDDKHVTAEFVALGEGEGEIPVEGEPVIVPGELVDVPAGTFQMGRPYADTGDSDEVPVHSVYLDAYRIGKYEVTNQEYADVLNWAYGRGYLKNSSGGAYTGGVIYAYNQPIADTETSDSWSQLTYSGGVFGVRSREGHGGVLYSMADHPMTEVTWYGAVCYCNWLSEKNGLQACYDTSNWTRYAPVRNGYRLPTEAEWERAAAWDGSRHWRYSMTSDTISFSRANYYEDGFANPLGLTSPYTTPVGWYNGVNPARVSTPGTLTVNATSPVGAYDMSGNAWEWCHDWWYREYTTEPVSNPTGPTSGSYRMLRGGSWSYYNRGTRSADRDGDNPGSRLNILGFRVAVSVSSR